MPAPAPAGCASCLVGLGTNGLRCRRWNRRRWAAQPAAPALPSGYGTTGDGGTADGATPAPAPAPSGRDTNGGVSAKEAHWRPRSCRRRVVTAPSRTVPPKSCGGTGAAGANQWWQLRQRRRRPVAAPAAPAAARTGRSPSHDGGASKLRCPRQRKRRGSAAAPGRLVAITQARRETGIRGREKR